MAEPGIARRAGAEGTALLLAASTSFASPAVTLARAATNIFAGIRPADAPGFIAAQLVGAAGATALFRWPVPVVEPAKPAEES